MIREAMELLFLAANKEEFSENKYLWNLRKFEQDLTEVNLEILKGLEKDADTSMQRDVAAGRPSEAEGLIHNVVELAGKYGLVCPGYRMVSRWARERGL